MITIDQSNLLQQLQYAAELAVKHKEKRLLSYVSQVSAPDILTIFANGKELGSHHRSFWMDGDGLTLVGIGTTSEMVAHGSDRFKKTKRFWQKISQNVIKNIETKGTGPLMMGGFSFNDSDASHNEWNHFQSSAFVIPRFLFTENEGQTWLTINIEINPDINIEKTYNQLAKEVGMLLDMTSHHKTVIPKVLELKPESSAEWLESVKQVTERIRLGEVEKVVLSRVLNAQLEEDIRHEALLKNLIERRSYGFVFAFERDGDCFIGATPERLVKQDGKLAYCDCLAGTEARGATAEEDQALGAELLKDDKNLAEHHFVVEMIKQSMSSFASDVIAPERPQLVKAESVQHLYTPVSGWMNNGTTIIDAIEQLHPTPAMGGTPREKAISIINELEPHQRGWYASPIGWIDEDGNGDFAVGIRSCLVLGKTVRLFAGCGIVRDSIPEKEYRETKLKFGPILNALEAPLYD